MNPCRILVVEDEAIVAMDIEDRLLSMGYQLAGRADNGEEAVTIAASVRPNLVLMDIRLRGGMDGITTADEIRRRFHVPVIFLTAYSEDATLQRAKLVEPFGYILKPFDDRELKSAIEIALYKHRAEEEIRRLNRLYDVLSQVNQTVVRCSAREDLLPEVCRLMVDRGAVDLAWIGAVDSETSRIVPVASHGTRTDFLEAVEFFANGRVEKQGNPGRAILEGKPFVCNDCGRDRCALSAEASPAWYGLRSCGSFPLRFQDRVWGVLSLCVGEAGFFRGREIELLKEVAMDVSFALDKIEGDAQRERLRLELQRQSTFLRTLMDAMPYPVFYKDARLRYLGCNAALENFFACKRDRIVGRTAHDLWPADLADTYELRDRELLARGGTQVFETSIRTFQGKNIDVVLHKAVYRDQDGGMGIVGAIEDVTERNRTEAALRASEARFRSYVEYAPMGIVVNDRSGRYVEVNPAASRLLGYTESELLELTAGDLLAPESMEAGGWHVHKTVHEGAAVGDLLLRRSDGSTFWASVHSVALDDDRFMTFWEDVTERRQAETALRQRLELQDQIAKIAASVPGVIYSFRLRPDGSSCLPYAAPPIEDLFGISREALARDASVLFSNSHPEDREHLVAGITAASRDLSPWHDAYRYRHPEKGERWVEGWSMPQLEPDGSVLWHGFVMDVTARKRAEEEKTGVEAQLRQAQKMEALGTLAGGIAHDFNNILAAIVGYTEMACWGKDERNDDHACLQQVLKAADRAKDLVQQILAFSRRGDQERKPVQVGLIVKEALKMLRASLPSTIEISRNVNSKAVVEADPTQIHQVLMNLCTNAAHAMREKGGVLNVALTDAVVEPEDIRPHQGIEPGPFVRLTVQDTGHGIPRDMLDRIFDPFFTTKEQGVGTGLGLAVVHGIVSNHGGVIEVESTPGAGTTFSVLLPAKKIAAVNETVDNSPLPRGREHLLVVDDEPALAVTTRKMLERLGYDVETRMSGLEAIEAFRRALTAQPFDLVITDMTMPHLTGLDLARELKRLEPGLPVILCTGFSEQIKDAALKDLGLQGLLMKPFNVRNLAELIREVLDGPHRE